MIIAIALIVAWLVGNVLIIVVALALGRRRTRQREARLNKPETGTTLRAESQWKPTGGDMVHYREEE